MSLERRGRPRVAEQVSQVTVTLPVDIIDLCSREALARNIPLAAVIRDAIIASRRQRGEV